MSEEEKRYTQSMEETTSNQTDSTDVALPAENTEAIPTAETVQKKKKSPVIFGVLAVLAVLIVASIVFFAKERGISSASDTENSRIEAKITMDGTAYISLSNGKIIEIQGDVTDAWLTRDQKYVVVLQKDGTLYVTDMKQSEKNILADNAASIHNIREDGIIYIDKNENAYRVLFKDYSTVELGNDISIVAADNTISALYATGEGNVYTLAADASEPNKVDTFDYQVRLKDISDDGQSAVWTDQKGKDYRIILNTAGESQTLGSVTPSYSSDYTNVSFTKDQKLMVIASSLSDHFWIRKEGKDVVDVNLGAELASTTIYSQKGYLSEENASDVSALYVETEGDSENNLYCITLDGERDRVITGINDVEIENGKIFYTNEDGNLYYATLDGANLKNEEKIASDVELFDVEGKGNYIYYVKSSGALYCYKVGEKEPVKVAAEVATLYGIITYNKYSADGSTVLYYTDLEEVKDTYKDYGTLMMWSYGEDEPEKVSSDVLTNTINSGLKRGVINKNSFTYLKYDSVNADGDVYANWMYNNGKESEKIAGNVIV